MKSLLALALPLYALDQATKAWIVTHLEFDSQHPVIPGFFDLVYFGNTGAAFSILQHNNVFFIVVSLITLVGLLYASMRGMFPDRLSRIGVGLLMAGILGNVTDRLVHHYVVDFLLFDLHVPLASPWPAFNVADSCICVAVGLFVLASFRKPAPAAAA